jgi:tRNA-splicing ligase RtcB
MATALPHTFTELPSAGVPIRAWTEGVPFEDAAQAQLRKLAQLPIIHSHIAVMPDVHLGIGATVGSVVPTVGAIIPAAVGVDIGCGMAAVRTSIKASDLPDDLKGLRTQLERAVPHGRTMRGGKGDRGAWGHPPARVLERWSTLHTGHRSIIEKHPVLNRGANAQQLGTLGGGNHFIELCLDEEQCLWVMLHSGSRGVGNRIGTYFIDLAREEMHRQGLEFPDRDLGYFREGSVHFDDYVFAVSWAQDFARQNREVMMTSVLEALRDSGQVPAFTSDLEAVNCHHNYVAREVHRGADIFVTRKGAVRAGLGELGIIPGSMGAKSFIVRGKGNPDSFESCSHGAGRRMSRTEAKKRFTVADHRQATAGVECRKDEDVIDETPMAYKDIDAVMHAQRDLVEIVHTLKQVVCVKG